LPRKKKARHRQIHGTKTRYKDGGDHATCSLSVSFARTHSSVMSYVCDSLVYLDVRSLSVTASFPIPASFKRIVPSHLISPRLVRLLLCLLVSSCLALPGQVCLLVLSCLILSSPDLSCLALSWSCHAFSYLISSFVLVLFRLVVSSLVLFVLYLSQVFALSSSLPLSLYLFDFVLVSSHQEEIKYHQLSLTFLSRQRKRIR
jgi:hypothetical protein